MTTNPKINVSGFDIEWDADQALNLWAGVPTLSMWIPGTTAGLMEGFVNMVGIERFNLCLQLAGHRSIETDWQIIAGAPSFEQGLAALAEIAWPAGWGRWTLVLLDRERKEFRMQVRNSWEALYQRELNVCWGSAMTAGKFGAYAERLFSVPCWAEQTVFAAEGNEYDEFVIHPAKVSIEERLTELLQEGRATSADLAAALSKLKTEISEREKTAAQLREKLELIEQQETALRTLTALIITVWEGVLMVPVMGGLDSGRATILMERLLNSVVMNRSRHVILDLTAVDTVDPATADHLLRIVRGVELLGARAVVTGIQPGVSQTLASFTGGLGGIKTLRNLQEGLKMCMGLMDNRM